MRRSTLPFLVETKDAVRSKAISEGRAQPWNPDQWYPRCETLEAAMTAMETKTKWAENEIRWQKEASRMRCL